MRTRRAFRLLPNGIASSPRVAWLAMVGMVLSVAAATGLGSEIAIDGPPGSKTMVAIVSLGDGS